MLVFIPTFTVGLVDTIIAKTWLRREYIYILRNIRCGFFLLALWFTDVDPPISNKTLIIGAEKWMICRVELHCYVFYTRISSCVGMAGMLLLYSCGFGMKENGPLSSIIRTSKHQISFLSQDTQLSLLFSGASSDFIYHPRPCNMISIYLEQHC